MDQPVQPDAASHRPSRSWISHSRRHTQRVHPLNVRLTAEANAILRDIARDESLCLYEVIEKALVFYRQRHPGPSQD
jgi:hypothetical protein